MFNKLDNSKLLNHIANFGRREAERQAILTQLIANVVYQSISGNNIDPGIKLVGAMAANGYNRRNDVITYLCQMGNFSYKKDKGLQFKARFPKNEELALEMAEKCIANPMFSIVREAAVKTEIDILADIRAYLAKVRRELDKATKEGRHINVQHEELISKLAGLAA